MQRVTFPDSFVLRGKKNDRTVGIIFTDDPDGRGSARHVVESGEGKALVKCKFMDDALKAGLDHIINSFPDKKPKLTVKINGVTANITSSARSEDSQGRVRVSIPTPHPKLTLAVLDDKWSIDCGSVTRCFGTRVSALRALVEITNLWYAPE